jgi:arylsulfatase A-like enzyme
MRSTLTSIFSPNPRSVKILQKSAIGLFAAIILAAAPAAAQQQQKPNILVIFGDDIGQTNISAYSFGVVGYKTPNIDRIAREGLMFTDYYAENSCTAGRSTFITGQSPLRTGLSKVGAPALRWVCRRRT